MREKDKTVEVQGASVKMFKMQVLPALELWDILTELFSESTQNIKSVSEAEMFRAFLSILGNGNVIKISNKILKYIHINDKNIKDFEELDLVLEGLDVDTLCFLDDLLIDFLVFQFENKLNNMKKKAGIQKFNVNTLLDRLISTGESGE